MYYMSHRHPRSCGFKPSIRLCRKQREKVDQHYFINQANDSVTIILNAYYPRKFSTINVIHNHKFQ